MAHSGLLKMKKADDVSSYDLSSDFREVRVAARKLGNHAVELLRAGLLTSLLQWFATIAAIYLLVLDRTNWRTNMLTSLLVPYLFLNLPSVIFNIFRGEVGKWIAFIGVVLRLFFPTHFPDWLEMPGSLIILVVVTPHLIVELRSSWIGVIVSLVIGAYLLQEHIRKNGGFKKAFAERKGGSNTVGIILLFISPLWELIKIVL